MSELYKFTFNDIPYECDIDANVTHPTTGQEVSVADWIGLSASDVAAIKKDKLREHRDKLLAITDWWAVQDRNPTAAQLEYRQALRDITQTYTSLEDVVWPTKPEV